jgi:hypothetical protein
MKTEEVVKPLDLKYGGAVLMDMDDDPSKLKDAVLYLDIKVKGMGDEHYIEWLKMFNMSLDEMQDEMGTPGFGFLFKNRVHTSGAVLAVVHMLLEQNGLINNEKPKYIIDNPY